jgi:hypothetical protein
LERGFGTTNNMNQEKVVDVVQVNNVYIVWNVINKTCYFTKMIMNKDELIRFANAFSIL